MTEAEVLRTHAELFNGALKSRDWDQLAAIYSDDYMLVRPDGSVLSKEEVLADLRIGGLALQAIEIADVKIRIHGDTPFLTAASRTVTSRQGKEAKSHIRLVAVYVTDQSRPRLVHFQSVLLPD
jgi:ketosteroid isomerase-like protein